MRKQYLSNDLRVKGGEHSSERVHKKTSVSEEGGRKDRQ